MKNREIILPLLSIVICILIVSSIGATFSWYQYNSNVFLKYNGTSIGNTTTFDIGLVSEVELNDYQSFNMVKDNDNENIYWCNEGISKEISSLYLSSNGYSTNEVNGVTSGEFDEINNNFTLKRAPYHNENYFDNFNRPINALKRDYSHFDLVFRANKISGSSISPITSGSIYLSNIELDSLGNIKDSIRIHYESSVNNFIFNPSSLNSGSTTVGGLLDLNKDGLYDYNSFNNKETVYGECVNKVYNNTVTTNGVDENEFFGNSFVAEHKNGIFGINESETIYKKAKFKGYDEVVTSKMDLATISESSLAYLSLDIYLEGWDNSFIDKEMNHMFSLNMEFSLNE